MCWGAACRYLNDHPLHISDDDKARLTASVLNDTLLMEQVNVMDYSMLTAITDRGEIVLGIIDYIRQYTWDKHLETWVKSSSLLQSGRGAPTVISPTQYKERFRQAMSDYFSVVPLKWTAPRAHKPTGQ